MTLDEAHEIRYQVDMAEAGDGEAWVVLVMEASRLQYPTNLAGILEMCNDAKSVIENESAMYGRNWDTVSSDELCPKCGQPDNCGDCTHEPLTDDDYARLRNSTV